MTLKSRLLPAAKKPQIGHRDGLLQEPALGIQDEVFSRHNKVLRFEQLCRLELRREGTEK
jgi:hypothetical protein